MNKFRMACVLAGVLQAALASATMFDGHNLIVNPGFDDGSAMAGGAIGAVPGWSGLGGVGTYGPTNWWQIPSGPWASGQQFFAGGSVPTATVTQTYAFEAADVPSVDAGGVSINVSGWFGGWAGQNDTAFMQVYALDSLGQTIAMLAQLGGPTAAQRGNASKMLFETATVSVPSTAKAIEFRLIAQRHEGSANDACADTLSCVAATKPGDIDGDGDVDIDDYDILAFAYGSFDGDPTYNAAADLDHDGDVDIDDYDILAANYGT